MEIMDTHIVNFTSFAARKAFGKVKDNGQITDARMQWYNIS
jgi:hypothetical protein